MDKKYKLGFIGGGFMASSIIKGLINSENKMLSANQIIVSDLSVERLIPLAKTGVKTVNDNLFLVQNSEFVFFAVKPQNCGEIFLQLKNSGAKKIISIMAGVKKYKFYESIENCMVARCMPNTPCTIKMGTVGLDLSDYADYPKDVEFIKNIFSNIADVVILSEEKMDAVTGISGSGPAYVYLFIDALVKAGIKEGLSEEEARRLAIGTVKGGAAMLEYNSDKKPEELIKNVCSKGGTTIEAMNVFERENFAQIIEQAVSACVKRSKELSAL